MTLPRKRNGRTWEQYVKDVNDLAVRRYLERKPFMQSRYQWKNNARRERMVRAAEKLHLLSQGLTIKQIAAKFNVTPDAVRMQLRFAREQLKADSNTHAIAIAFRKGLLK